MFRKLISKINYPIILKFILLITIGIIFIYKNFNDNEVPFVSGDGFEYAITTEAFINHYSNEIKLSDIKSYKEKCAVLCNGWENFPKRTYINDLISSFEDKEANQKSHIGEYYINKSGKWYSFHFSAYSLINVPVYSILNKKEPIKAFYITNTILTLITCFFILFYSGFSSTNSILATVCFCFSSVFWYINWIHTEVFTMCFVAMGLIFYFRKYYFLGLFLISIACMQNQPLILLLAFLSINALIQVKFTIKNIFKIAASCFLAFLPPLFYYFNFGTTNLIKDAGFLDSKYVTLNRVFGFYFDVNQGVILAVPLILLSFVFLFLQWAISMVRKKEKFNLLCLVPVVLIVISIVFSTMGNWNHGMAIVNRYATWMSIIIMFFTFYLTNKKKIIVSTFLFGLYASSQIFTTLYHQQFNVYDWSSGTNRPLAKWFYRNHPELYSPDPVIFVGRSTPNVSFDQSNSPYLFFSNHRIKKMMVHRNKIDHLVAFGYDLETIRKIKEDAWYNYDWSYVNVNKFKSNFSDDQIYNMVRKQKIETAKNKILQNDIWREQLETKAKSWGKTFEEVLLMDAEYFVNAEEEESEKH